MIPVAMIQTSDFRCTIQHPVNSVFVDKYTHTHTHTLVCIIIHGCYYGLIMSKVAYSSHLFPLLDIHVVPTVVY